RPALSYQLVIDIARALLIAVQNAILEPGVQRLGLGAVDDRALHIVGHCGSCDSARHPAPVWAAASLTFRITPSAPVRQRRPRPVSLAPGLACVPRMGRVQRASLSEGGCQPLPTL